MIGYIAAGLLGAYVVYRADNLTRDGFGFKAGKACNTEVHHFDCAVHKQHNVMGLNITVNNTLIVCVLERS